MPCTSLKKARLKYLLMGLLYVRTTVGIIWRASSLIRQAAICFVSATSKCKCLQLNRGDFQSFAEKCSAVLWSQVESYAASRIQAVWRQTSNSAADFMTMQDLSEEDDLRTPSCLVNLTFSRLSNARTGEFSDSLVDSRDAGSDNFSPIISPPARTVSPATQAVDASLAAARASPLRLTPIASVAERQTASISTSNGSPVPLTFTHGCTCCHCYG